MKTHVLTVVFAGLATLLLLSSCAGFELTIQPSDDSSSSTEQRAAGSGAKGNARSARSRDVGSLPAVGNNETVTLDAGTYAGGVTIRSNKATLQGAGVGRTVIDGNLVVSGNVVAVRGLTIRGNVRLDGNNADLTGAEITDRVVNNGNNNSW